MSDLRNAMQNMTIDVEKSLPPCTACQRDVSTRDSVQVFQLPYHRDCLNCARCKTSLGQHAGTNNIAEYKSRPICIDCHCFYQGKTCAKCGEGAAHAVNALGKRFHKHCFTCAGLLFWEWKNKTVEFSLCSGKAATKSWEDRLWRRTVVRFTRIASEEWRLAPFRPMSIPTTPGKS